MSTLRTMLVSAVFLPTFGCNANRACTEDGARMLARAALVSSPIFESNLKTRMQPPPESIDELIARNSAAFYEDGSAIRCASALGPYLVKAGLAAYDPNVYTRRMGGGPEELRPDVARSLNSDAVAIYSAGLEVNWLANVLPSLAKGNPTPYRTTGTETRLKARQIGIPALDFLLRQGDDCGGCTIAGALEVMEQQSKLAEEQIFMLAMMMK